MFLSVVNIREDIYPAGRGGALRRSGVNRLRSCTLARYKLTYRRSYMLHANIMLTWQFVRRNQSLLLVSLSWFIWWYFMSFCSAVLTHWFQWFPVWQVFSVTHQVTRVSCPAAPAYVTQEHMIKQKQQQDLIDVWTLRNRSRENMKTSLTEPAGG